MRSRDCSVFLPIRRRGEASRYTWESTAASNPAAYPSTMVMTWVESRKLERRMATRGSMWSTAWEDSYRMPIWQEKAPSRSPAASTMPFLLNSSATSAQSTPMHAMKAMVSYVLPTGDLMVMSTRMTRAAASTPVPAAPSSHAGLNPPGRRKRRQRGALAAGRKRAQSSRHTNAAIKTAREA